MADFPSRTDYLNIARDYLIQKATKLDISQVDVDGSDANLFVGSVSVLCDAVTKQLAYSVNRLLLDGADGDDLDRYAFDRYSLVRKGASPAVGQVQFTRPNFAGGAGTVPIGTKLQTSAAIEYLTTSTGNFGATDLLTVANVRASQAGKVTQVGANQIQKFSNAGVLFDKSLLVNNALATAGGEDVEDDDTFRARVRTFWTTARRGILAAIEFGALTVPGVVSAQAIEVLTSGNMPARVVELFIADSSGVASDQLATAVRSALDDYRAGGIAVLVNTSLPLIVDIDIVLQFRAGVDTVTLADEVRAAVVEFTNSLEVNGTLYVAQLFSVIQRFSADGVIAEHDAIVAPVGDLVPAVGHTIRTTVTNVTIEGA